jgi:diguanylate cyclase
VNSGLKCVRLSAENLRDMSAPPDTSPNGLQPAPSTSQLAYVRYAWWVLAMYLGFALVSQIEVMFGLIDQRESIGLTVFVVSGAAAFAWIILSGANRHVRGDPSLTQAQCVFAIVSLCWMYAIQGPARGAVISVMVLILVFGMFALSAAQAVRISALAFVLLSGVMLWKSHTDPTRYPAAVEWIHFMFAGLVSSSIALLSARLARLRQRLKDQNAALSVALEQIRRLATRDDLTGLLNRRHMSELLVAERARHGRSRHATSLALIDIDLFKRINDAHGHAAGDAVLKVFAETALGCLRASDVLARWGGEEFLLMLPDTEAGAAQLCIERIRTHLAAASFDAIQPGLQVTFSTGLSVLGAHDTVETLIERADQAMYAAKRAGRNCTMTG